MYATKLPVNDLRRISTALFSRLFLSENGRVVTNGKHPRALPESPEKLRLSRAHCKVKILVHENFTELNLEKAGLLINKMGNKIVYNTPLVNAMQYMYVDNYPIHKQGLLPRRRGRGSSSRKSLPGCAFGKEEFLI